MTAASLERRLSRLEAQHAPSSRLITVKVAGSPERDEQDRLVRLALAEREIVPVDRDFVVIIQSFSAEPSGAYVLGVQPMAAR